MTSKSPDTRVGTAALTEHALRRRKREEEKMTRGGGEER